MNKYASYTHTLDTRDARAHVETCVNLQPETEQREEEEGGRREFV